jgi:hypothetical protein
MLTGAGLMVLAYIISKRMKRWKSTAIATTGHILTLTKERTRDFENKNSVNYYCDIQFNANGKPIQFKTKVPNAPNKFAVGTQLPVYYNQHDPNDAKLSVENRLLTIFLTVIGVFFTLVGLLFH